MEPLATKEESFPQSIFQMVRDFHIKYKQPLDRPLDNDSIRLRTTLVREEASEFEEELMNLATNQPIKLEQIDKANLTKELADILYVTIGTAATWGLPLEEVFRRVHESNMSKDGGFRSDGKILKGPSYKAPELEDLFQ